MSPATHTHQYVHTVGYLAGLWAAFVGRPPRARCGANLEQRPDDPITPTTAPACPDCQR